MYILYDLAVYLTAMLLHVPALFQPKLRAFLKGRREVWTYLQAFRDKNRPLIWMHAASLGEFEQGLPVLQGLQKTYPDYQFLVTFFSPSGYEIKKDKIPGAGVAYLPLDKRAAARRFLKQAAPSLALFIKYEVWPNFYRELERAGIPNLMISALFKPGQAYFKWYGGFMKKTLSRVRHFYLQDDASARLLDSIGMHNHEICGDTRFDRVREILSQDNSLSFMERFTGGRTCLVAGSTWPEDEKVLLPWIRRLDFEEYCVVLAPHTIHPAASRRLLEALGEKAVRYSEGSSAINSQAGVLILDTIGLLTRVYSYAALAYVGGGFATGLHNTLEPAVFGIPVIIGPHYQGFREAEDLVRHGGLLPVDSAASFDAVATGLLTKPEKRSLLGQANAHHIKQSAGASGQILRGIEALLKR